LLLKEGKKNLDIIIQRSQEYLMIQVRDNGIGRHVAKEKDSEYGDQQKSRGIDITRNRVEKLQPQFGESGIEIKDLFSPEGKPSGTAVTLRLPLIIKK